MSRYIDIEYLKKKKRFLTAQQRYIVRMTDIYNAPSIDLDIDVWCEDCKEYDKEHHNCPRFNRVIRTALEDAGMVSVVRCGECRHRITGIMGKMCIGRHPDDFCSYGERKDNE